MGWSDYWKPKLGFCGEDVFIGDNVFFGRPDQVSLGDRTRIAHGCYITAPLSTGNSVQIEAMAVLAGVEEVYMDDWTFIGFQSLVMTSTEDYSGRYGPVNQFWGQNRSENGTVRFRDYSGIASKVTVFPGITLPRGCTIGLGSMVRRSPTREWSIYFGGPLQHMGDRDRDTVVVNAADPDFLKHHTSTLPDLPGGPRATPAW